VQDSFCQEATISSRRSRFQDRSSSLLGGDDARMSRNKPLRRVIAPELPRAGRAVELAEGEARHATQVLRLGNGDRVEVLDAKGGSCIACLRVRDRKVFLDFVSAGGASADQIRASGVAGAHGLAPASVGVLPLDLEVAILKGEAMEWVVEKCVELGVRSVAPVITAHTVVQVDRKGPEAFRERWQRIADQALKQCGRLSSMRVLSPRSLEGLLSDPAASSGPPRLIADESRAGSALSLGRRLERGAPWGEGLRVLVGPEGGWSVRERELLEADAGDFVSLGPLILRAETACLYSMGVAASFLRDALVERISETGLNSSGNPLEESK
jgi:16S rRNA (uracil1498-N3)-methyltransferase